MQIHLNVNHRVQVTLRSRDTSSVTCLFFKWKIGTVKS